MGKMLSIALSGIDGSGKSTVVKLLEVYLKKKGFKVCTIWFGWRAFISYVLYAYARLTGSTKAVRSRSNSVVKITSFHSNPVLKRIRPWALFFDMLIFYFIFKLRIFLRGVTAVVYDRFFIDALVDLIYQTQRIDILDTIISTTFLKIMSRLSIVILLKTNPCLAYQRKQDIVSISELKIKDELYDKILESLKNTKVIDTSKDLKSTIKSIIDSVNIVCMHAFISNKA